MSWEYDVSADQDHVITETLGGAPTTARAGDPGATTDLPASLDDGRYLVGPLLGRGGSGEVFRAFDRRLGRAVALKVFPPGSVDAEDVRRWREVRTLAALEHPRLVRIFDVGEHDTRPFFVMQLVEGRSLAALLAEGTLDVGETLRLGTGLAGGLGHVHHHGIVHRDVKPANVLLDHAGRAHLADFGIATRLGAAALTGEGLVLGTAAYLAPEQVRGRHVGAPADVYALGLVLLEALTGRRQYPGDPIESAVARLHRPPERPDWLPTEVDAVLRAMTHEDPAQRPSAGEVAGHLAKLLPPGDAEDAEDAVAPPANGTRWGAVGEATGAGPVLVPAPTAIPALVPAPAPVPVGSGASVAGPPARRFLPRALRPAGTWVAVAAGFALVAAVTAAAIPDGPRAGASATLGETPPGPTTSIPAPGVGSIPGTGLLFAAPAAPAEATGLPPSPVAGSSSRTTDPTGTPELSSSPGTGTPDARPSTTGADRTTAADRPTRTGAPDTSRSVPAPTGDRGPGGSDDTGAKDAEASTSRDADRSGSSGTPGAGSGTPGPSSSAGSGDSNGSGDPDRSGGSNGSGGSDGSGSNGAGPDGTGSGRSGDPGGSGLLGGLLGGSDRGDSSGSSGRSGGSSDGGGDSDGTSASRSSA